MPPGQNRSPVATPPPADPAHDPAAPRRSPLLLAALALISPSATERDVDRRFAALGAALEPGTATRLLAELAQLGLVRMARHAGHGARYVPTTLGLHAAGGGLDGSPGVALEELERLRTDLLSTISHELRTPLTAVRTNVGLLLDADARPTAEQQRTLLESIERNADRMQRLLGDILELSRFRAGGVALQLRSFDAQGLARTAISVVAPLAAQHGQQIDLVAATEERHQVYGDRRRLEQALINLVANAQRYSPDGAGIRVGLEHRGDHTAWVVEDDGPGIAEADQARLFERFFVGRNGRPGPRGGIGLGLPTALAIAQAHGGTVEVASVVGRGSTFALVVPDAGPEDLP